MTSIRPFQLDDLLIFNNVNLDALTETYNGSFYMAYLSQWPESFLIAKAPSSASTCTSEDWYDNDESKDNCSTNQRRKQQSERVMGYLLGKAEGDGSLWHGHVSAVTVAPEYRRLGLAATLMETFEDVCKNQYNAYFVDLFVRASNTLAIKMYEQFGYTTYRRVLGYYSGESPEDALDMRKALPRDVNKESIVPLDHPVLPEDLEW